MRQFLFFLFVAAVGHSQSHYPTDYFSSPLGIPLSLSGSFGELRSNHFHSGLDFRTQQKEGLPVYATADGYVSRIKISAFGYGKALYITHPNGYTSVYGHLLEMNPEIAAFLKQKHYELQQFEVDLFLKPTDLPVKKGQQIALSGNTGGSGGPHLHFEYRDTQTEKIINPFYFGLDKLVVDTKPPVVADIIVYPLSEDAVVNKSQQPISVPIIKQKDGTYMASSVLARGEIGVGVHAYDVSDNSYGKNGLFKLKATVNGTPSYEVDFTTFSYDETRYINAYLDYYRYKKMNQRVQRLFYTKPYPLSLIAQSKTNGVLKIEPNVTLHYQLELSDFHGNKVWVTLPFKYSNQPVSIPKNQIQTPYHIKSEKEYRYEKEGFSVYFPENTFYENFYLKFNVTNQTLQLHDDSVAVHSNFSVSYFNDSIPETERHYYFLATKVGSKILYNATKYKMGTFTTWTRNLGSFYLEQDKVAPLVKPVNVESGKWMSKEKKLLFTISDALSGIKSYQGFLNGKWILFDYDFKTQTLMHDFSDGIVEEGRNELKLEVTDNLGNSTIFETHFFRSQKP